MKYARRKTWLFALMIAATDIWTSATSNVIESADILGTWCSKTAKIRFTRDAMTVTLFSRGEAHTYKIVSYKFSGTYVRITWINYKDEEVWAEYSDFSRDGRRMYLQKNRVAPRRKHNRC